MNKKEFRKFLNKIGYKYGRYIGNNKYLAYAPQIGDHGVIVGDVRNEFTYIDRWDYPTLHNALACIMIWDGEGDAPGPWNRHLKTERRRPENYVPTYTGM